jgi:hypothetical protein
MSGEAQDLIQRLQAALAEAQRTAAPMATVVALRASLRLLESVGDGALESIRKEALDLAREALEIHPRPPLRDAAK